MEIVIIAGDYGSGKSSSAYADPDLGIKGIKPDELIVFSGTGKKPMGKFGPLYHKRIVKIKNVQDMYNKLEKLVDRFPPNVKVVLVDDFFYMMSNMLHDSETHGGKVWDTYNAIGKYTRNILTLLQRLPEHVLVVLVMHTGNSENGIELKLLGKHVEEKYNPLGISNYVFLCEKVADIDEEGNEVVRSVFRANVPGTWTKVPPGFFKPSETYIPNDLNIVYNRIKEASNPNIESQSFL